MPTPPAILPSSGLYREIKPQRVFGQDPTISSFDDFIKASNNGSLRMSIEQSVVIDIRPEDESIERGIDASPPTIWDRGYSV
jgi:hypothetical protein